MDETYVKVNGRLGVSVPGRRQPGAALSIFISSSRRNSKAVPVSGKNPQQREEVADPASSTRIKRLPMVARLLCSNREAPVPV